MLFSNKALGIEICSDGARMALVEKKQGLLKLFSFGTASFPGDTVRLSLREANVQNPSAFVAAVREMYLKLLTNVRSVSVSLPDVVGRVVLLDAETRFKSKEEGADIVRWKLKKTFPFDINKAHLDYQVIREKETGEISILVSLIARSVVNQYEDLLVEAGLEPNQIDFTTFNLHRLFAGRLELAENSVVIACYGGVVSILIFHGGMLEFCRVKEMPGGILEPNRVYRELNSSFLIFQEKYPGHSPSEAFCIYSADEAEAFSPVIAEATGLEPVLLDVERVVARDNGFSVDRKTLRTLTAALGAATRNL
jgi:type IV pilus assembly protein PilM